MFGNNNLIIRQKITKQVNKKINDNCDEKKSVSDKKLSLKYNNKTDSYN